MFGRCHMQSRLDRETLVPTMTGTVKNSKLVRYAVPGTDSLNKIHIALVPVQIRCGKDTRESGKNIPRPLTNAPPPGRRYIRWSITALQALGMYKIRVALPTPLSGIQALPLQYLNSMAGIGTPSSPLPWQLILKCHLSDPIRLAYNSQLLDSCCYPAQRQLFSY